MSGLYAHSARPLGRGSPAPKSGWVLAIVLAACTSLLAVGPAGGPFLSWDAAATRILAPLGTVDSGSTATPQARVKNLGDSIVSFPAILSIGTSYVDTQYVTDLNPGESLTVNFTQWTALQRGSNRVACSTALNIDENPANDRCSSFVTVRVRDVGVTQLIAPIGLVDSGSAVIPQARVTNFGSTTPGMFSVYFRIGTVYLDTVTVMGLAPGTSRVLSFGQWIAQPVGTHAVKCTTAYNNDVYPDNNSLEDSCTVENIPLDAGVRRIVAPRGIVDSGTVIAPQAVVGNYSDGAASFPVIFRISPAYIDTFDVTDLGPGETLLVTFADWTAAPAGTLVTRCSTALAGDGIPANDAMSDSVNVIILTRDVGALRIIAPTDTLDSGTVVAPQAVVMNYGEDPESFPVILRIGTTFVDTQQVSGLLPDDSLTVVFRDWTAGPRGTRTIRCSTALEGDQIPANNVATGTAYVLVRDAGVSRINAPTGTVDSGAIVTPSARARNYGNTLDSFPVIFRISTFYADTQMTTGQNVSFRPCTLTVRGTYTTQCTTCLDGDMNPANDMRTDSFTVGPAVLHDIGVNSILAPVGIVELDDSIFPQAILTNYGPNQEFVLVRFRIGEYRDSGYWFAPGLTTDTVSLYRAWVATPVGTYTVCCSTALANDTNLANNFLYDSVQVVTVGVQEVSSARARPERLELSRATPNPFDLGTAISYGIPRRQGHCLAVYNSVGELVHILSSGSAEPGFYTTTWRGSDIRQRPVSRGIYFVRLDAEDASLTCKLVKLE